jgi:hypothetical protein
MLNGSPRYGHQGINEDTTESTNAYSQANTSTQLN